MLTQSNDQRPAWADLAAAMLIFETSSDGKLPYLNLAPIVAALVKMGNETLDGGFVLNPDGWRCGLAKPIDFAFVRSTFELPPSIDLSEAFDTVHDRRSWYSIEGPGASNMRRQRP
jgi:hypothetical protein